MDIHFAAESVSFSMSGRSQWPYNEDEEESASAYALRGYATPKVGDYFPPPDETQFLSTAQIWTMERIPLRTTVLASSEDEWTADPSEKSLERLRARLEAEGMTDEKVVSELLREYAAIVRRATAKVYYSPPDKSGEYSSRRDAILQIVLRLRTEELARWNAFCQRHLGEALPPCAVRIFGVKFAQVDADTASCGWPTWSRFLAGGMYAPAEGGFLLSVMSDWADLAF